MARRTSAREGHAAAWLGVPKSRVAVTAGGWARFETVIVTGEPAELAALVEMRAAGLE